MLCVIGMTTNITIFRHIGIGAYIIRRPQCSQYSQRRDQCCAHSLSPFCWLSLPQSPVLCLWRLVSSKAGEVAHGTRRGFFAASWIRGCWRKVRLTLFLYRHLVVINKGKASMYFITCLLSVLKKLLSTFCDSDPRKNLPISSLSFSASSNIPGYWPGWWVDGWV